MAGDVFDHVHTATPADFLRHGYESSLAEVRTSIEKHAPDYLPYMDEFLERLKEFQTAVEAFEQDLDVIQGFIRMFALVEAYNWRPEDLGDDDALPAMLPVLETWRSMSRPIPSRVAKQIEPLLQNDPDVVRVREGGGPEDLLMSLAVTMSKTRASRDARK